MAVPSAASPHGQRFHSPSRSRQKLEDVDVVVRCDGLTAGQAPHRSTTVTSGDVVYLINQFSSGTYLDTNGYSTRQGAKYGVSTTATKDRGPGTGKWHIFGKTSSPTDGHIRTNDIVRLLNDYGSANGGFLDTNGHASQHGAKYDVTTGPYTDRGTGTGSWKVLRTT
ncbi:hypothetical protein [Streptomyces sp. NPDC001020]